MKRFGCIVLAAFMLFLSCCSTHVRKGGPVELVFVYEDISVHQTLPTEEAEKVIQILNGKTYDPINLVPACGFDRDIALKVWGRTYAVALDTCNGFMDVGALRYFSVSQEDIEYIHALFEKYGGFFPCI